jgi:hypothetical protein
MHLSLRFEFYHELQLASSSHSRTCGQFGLGHKIQTEQHNRVCKLPQVCLAKAHVTTLAKNSQHSVLENRPPLQKLHYASLTKTLVPRYSNKWFFGRWNDSIGAPLVETQCSGSNATDGSCIRVSV